LTNDLIEGELVVAKGKLAKIQQVFSEKNIRVQIVSTGAALMVAGCDIERIRKENYDNNVSRDANDYTSEQLLVFAERYDVIQKWRRGELTTAEGGKALGLSRSYFFRLAKLYDENLGPLSMALRRRGRKKGITRLTEDMETIISDATKRIFKNGFASFSKVWVEVDTTCKEKNLISPCKDTVLRRVKILVSEKEQFKLKRGKDAASQKYSSRPGKKFISRPLQWVQMDHTLVDVILLADDRVNIIGRPWWTAIVDLKTRVILGYYLSLHTPSSVSVACALSHSILPKKEFAIKLGLDPADYFFYGVPEVLHMDNASEFTSPKLKSGCTSFGIHPEYRPIGRKHYGGHIERLIGTFMTTKVHLLKGTTMSNAVARRGVDSEKNATMTFSEFVRWFAREVVVYHSTVHSELGESPRQAWNNFYAPGGGVPYPPKVDQLDRLKLYFMPEELRKIRPDGISLHGYKYWDPILAPFVGAQHAVVKYDPFNLNEVWVKLNGEFCPIRLSDLTIQALTYEEYRASKLYRKPIRAGAIDSDAGRKAYREKQKIEKESARLTRQERRRLAAEQIYRESYLSEETTTQERKVDDKNPPPDYSVRPRRFTPEN
ncbi:Mu transposase C-terminal domain-containing protein, partial [Pseudomonas sp. KCJK8993]|uniref:Mu transposase C-terminal domain-containing protein n=1 Tax=Pseudomonas sp. KCJK8993 TaxID=3344565 RepID=UPI0039059900